MSLHISLACLALHVYLQLLEVCKQPAMVAIACAIGLTIEILTLMYEEQESFPSLYCSSQSQQEAEPAINKVNGIAALKDNSLQEEHCV